MKYRSMRYWGMGERGMLIYVGLRREECASRSECRTDNRNCIAIYSRISLHRTINSKGEGNKDQQMLTVMLVVINEEILALGCGPLTCFENLKALRLRCCATIVRLHFSIASSETLGSS